MASSESHIIGTPSVPSVKCTLSWIRYSILQRENCKFVDFNDSIPVWRRSCKERLRISRKNFYWDKLESLIYISAVGTSSTGPRNYFWKSNALSQEALAENGFWHEIATQGHPRSFILQSVTGQQGVACISPYNIAGLIPEVSEQVATQIAKNGRPQQPHSHLMPRQEEPPRISACTLYCQKL